MAGFITILSAQLYHVKGHGLVGNICCLGLRFTAVSCAHYTGMLPIIHTRLTLELQLLTYHAQKQCQTTR
jgi:hypothetical protein